MTTATITDLTTATPIEIDTRLAELHGQAAKLAHSIEWNQDRILDQADMRVWVSGTWGVRGHYKCTGTFEDARALVTSWYDAYDAERGRGVKYDDLSDNARKAIGKSEYGRKYLAEHDAAVVELAAVRAEISLLGQEFWRRGGWTRKFLVTSSAGHLHSSMSCSTCRPSTTYGWWPELSGLTEAEAIEQLGKHADALCSVCFPTAPVAAKRTNITKAQAAKLAA